MLAVPFLGQNQLILRILRGEDVAPLEWAVSLGRASHSSGLRGGWPRASTTASGSPQAPEADGSA